MPRLKPCQPYHSYQFYNWTDDFRPFLVDPELSETDGLIDSFWSFAASAVAKTSSGEKPTVAEEATAVAVETLQDAMRRLDYKFPTGGYIDFLSPRRQCGRYSEPVHSFNCKRFSP